MAGTPWSCVDQERAWGPAIREKKKSREKGVSERVLSSLGGLLPGDPESGTQVPSRPGTLGTSGHLRSSQGGWETQGGHDNERRKAVPCRAVRILKRNGDRVEEGAHGPPRNPPPRLPRPARPGTSPPQPLARFGGVPQNKLTKMPPSLSSIQCFGALILLRCFVGPRRPMVSLQLLQSFRCCRPPSRRSLLFSSAFVPAPPFPPRAKATQNPL